MHIVQVRKTIGGSAVFHRVMLASALLAASSRPLAAQEINPGARVRITTSGTREPSVGNVVSATEQGLVARLASGDTIRVPASNLAGLEISDGQSRHIWLGAGLGFIGGAAVGALIGAATPPDANCNFMCDDKVLGEAIGAGLLGIAGTVVGGIIGATHTTENWRAIQLPGRKAGTEVTIRPDFARQRLTASIAF
ncbi:MAG: hypothetical protein ABI625_17675 [bacterium]